MHKRQELRLTVASASFASRAKQCFCSFLLAPAVLLAIAANGASAQTAILPYKEYSKRLDSARQVGPLTDAAFGANTSLYDGSTKFRVVDIELPGNNALPVKLARTMQVDDRSSSFRPTVGGFADWQVDIPYMDGTFDWNIGWKVGSGNGTTSRCTTTQQPALGGQAEPRLVWHGYNIHIPDVMSESLLVNDQAGVPQPTDGAAYPWVTKSGFRIRCLTSLASGSGQGFLAVGPDGTKYWFNWMVSKEASRVSIPGLNNPNNSIRRARVFLLATRVEDRHGNWVTYTYSGSNLTQINSSDTRNITLNWSGDKVTSAVAAGKTWTYQYKSGGINNAVFANGPGLETVTLPDGATWLYAATGTLAQNETWTPPYEAPPGTCDPFTVPDQAFAYTIKHPAGASSTFTFQGKRHYRTRVYFYCSAIPGTALEEFLVPNYFDTIALVSRSLSGPGLTPASWTYDYGEGQANTWGFCFQDQQTYQWDCSYSGPNTKLVTMTESGGRTFRYTFGTAADIDEGRLLAEEVVDGGVVTKRTDTTYIADADLLSQPFSPTIGSNLVSFQPMATQVRPVRETVITQDGTTFESYVNSFDNFARPTSVRQRSRIGGVDQASRTEVTVYEDRPAIWTVGQVKSRQYAGGSAKTFELTFHATSALPVTLTKFGALAETYTYNPDGTLASVKDGRNYVTGLSNWYRGIPRTVSFPDLTSVSAVVNSYGSITSVTDQLGYVTAYAYDAMGRVSQVTYPTGDTVAWAPTTADFVSVAGFEYGVPGGHWRQTVQTGNGRTTNIYDAQWRPVVTLTEDTANSATRSFVVSRYDSRGRLVFKSYPVGNLVSVNDSLKGVTTSYDSLDRVTQVQRDSELVNGQSVLTTSTAYLTGFQTRVTNPRGYQTTTSYQAFDQPKTDAPVSISLPEGVLTTIPRDLMGKPNSISRSGMYGGNLGVTRWYAYDANQRLCKTINPESGASYVRYDAAGNVDWTADGQPYTASVTCDDSLVATNQKTVRHYDQMNRVTWLQTPNGVADVSTSYFADGKVNTIAAGNPGNNPVVSSYAYNKRRLMTGEASQNGSTVYYLTHGYDANGNQSSLTYPDGQVVAYSPDALGRATQVAVPGGQVYASGISYHPTGAISSFTYGNGIVHSMTPNIRQLPSRSWDAYQGTAVLDDTYAYDANGNVDYITDALPVSSTSHTRDMGYDGLDRLVVADSPDAVWGQATYSYDPLDNLRTVTMANSGGTTRSHFFNYTPDNRLHSISGPTGHGAYGFTYDSRGNVTWKNVGITNCNTYPVLQCVGKVPQTFVFDSSNRLNEVTGVQTYRYDGLGRRVQTTDADGKTTFWIYSKAGQVIHSSEARRNQNVSYIYLGNSQVATRSTAWGTGIATVRYQHTDALGSPVVETDAGRAVIKRNVFSPWGESWGNTVVDGTGYTGHVMDLGTGLTYMQQRYYDPVTGAFLSMDPVQPDFGRAFNRYRYADGNPYRFYDPDGRASDLPGMFRAFVGMKTEVYGDSPKEDSNPKQSPGVKIADASGRKVADAHNTVVEKIPNRKEIAVYADKSARDSGRAEVAFTLAFMPHVAAVMGAISIASSAVALLADPTEERLESYTMALVTAGASRGLDGLGEAIPAKSVTVGYGAVEELRTQTKP